jgi:hypothetical protein
VFAEDTAAYLADFGVPSSFTSGATTYTPLVIFDEPDEGILGNRGISTQYEITYRTGDLPGLTNGSSITVKGQIYTLREPPKKIDDGAFSHAWLEV